MSWAVTIKMTERDYIEFLKKKDAGDLMKNRVMTIRLTSL